MAYTRQSLLSNFWIGVGQLLYKLVSYPAPLARSQSNQPAECAQVEENVTQIKPRPSCRPHVRSCPALVSHQECLSVPHCCCELLMLPNTNIDDCGRHSKYVSFCTACKSVQLRSCTHLHLVQWCNTTSCTNNAIRLLNQLAPSSKCTLAQKW